MRAAEIGGGQWEVSESKRERERDVLCYALYCIAMTSVNISALVFVGILQGCTDPAFFTSDANTILRV